MRGVLVGGQCKIRNVTQRKLLRNLLVYSPPILYVTDPNLDWSDTAIQATNS